jgi:hypothetical protein
MNKELSLSVSFMNRDIQLLKLQKQSEYHMIMRKQSIVLTQKRAGLSRLITSSVILQEKVINLIDHQGLWKSVQMIQVKILTKKNS